MNGSVKKPSEIKDRNHGCAPVKSLVKNERSLAMKYFIIVLSLYFVVHLLRWLFVSTPLYISIPVVWILLSVVSAVGWYFFMKGQPDV
jgi:hypothetical protein